MLALACRQVTNSAMLIPTVEKRHTQRHTHPNMTMRQLMKLRYLLVTSGFLSAPLVHIGSESVCVAHHVSSQCPYSSEQVLSASECPSNCKTYMSASMFARFVKSSSSSSLCLAYHLLAAVPFLRVAAWVQLLHTRFWQQPSVRAEYWC